MTFAGFPATSMSSATGLSTIDPAATRALAPTRMLPAQARVQLQHLAFCWHLRQYLKHLKHQLCEGQICCSLDFKHIQDWSGAAHVKLGTRECPGSGHHMSMAALAQYRGWTLPSPKMVAFTPICTWLPILGWRSPGSLPVPPRVTCCMMVTWSPTLAASPTTMPAAAWCSRTQRITVCSSQWPGQPMQIHCTLMQSTLMTVIRPLMRTTSSRRRLLWQGAAHLEGALWTRPSQSGQPGAGLRPEPCWSATAARQRRCQGLRAAISPLSTRRCMQPVRMYSWTTGPQSWDQRHVVQGMCCKALVAGRLGIACVTGGHLYAQRRGDVAALPHVVRHPLQLQRMEASVVEQRHCNGCACLILHWSALTRCRSSQLHNGDKAYLVLECPGSSLAYPCEGIYLMPCMRSTSGHWSTSAMGAQWYTRMTEQLRAGRYPGPDRQQVCEGAVADARQGVGEHAEHGSELVLLVHVGQAMRQREGDGRRQRGLRADGRVDEGRQHWLRLLVLRRVLPTCERALVSWGRQACRHCVARRRRHWCRRGPCVRSLL